MAAVALQLTP